LQYCFLARYASVLYLHSLRSVDSNVQLATWRTDHGGAG
jgi:hypothetical protein